MNAEQFERRTKQFALDAITLIAELPRNVTAQVIGRAASALRNICRRKLPRFLSRPLTSRDDC